MKKKRNFIPITTHEIAYHLEASEMLTYLVRMTKRDKLERALCLEQDRIRQIILNNKVKEITTYDRILKEYYRVYRKNRRSFVA
jgi:hypothetical protein